MSVPKRLLLAGGGTGGHLYPALAVAEALRLADSSWEVEFVGTARGIEARVVPPLGYTLHLLDVRPLRGKTLQERLSGLLRLPRAGWAARKLLRARKPALVLGVGGYAAGPAVLAAYAMGFPTWLMEANASAGMTNRVLAKVADRILLGHPNPELMRTGRAEVVGYPTRLGLRAVRDKAFVAPRRQKGRVHLRLLVMGGSQGARAINQTLPGALQILQKHGVDVELVHQTGPKELLRTQQAYRTAGVDDRGVVGYIDAMDQALCRAQLIVCRSGASTLAEVGVVGRPAILIPYPSAADDHQTANAQTFARAGAAKLLPERELCASRLAQDVLDYLEGDNLVHAQQKAKALGRPEATEDIVRKILGLSDPKGRHV